MGLPILRLCDSCVFYREVDNVCKAFPEGIPLKSSDTHFEPADGQVGEYVYEMDINKEDELSMFLRLNPETRMPVMVTYELPQPAINPLNDEELVEDGGA